MPSVYDSAGIPKASGGGAGGGVALSAAGGLISSGTALFSDVNGLSWGRAGQTITGSVGSGATATGNFGALSAGGGLVSSGTASFVDANGVTFTNNAQSFSASVAMQTFSNVGGQNITFGLSGGTALTASVAAGGAGPSLINWPHPWAMFVSSNVGLNSGTDGSTGGSTQFTAHQYFAPWNLPAGLAFTRVQQMISFGATGAGTGSITRFFELGIYTAGGSTLSRISSFRFVLQMSQNSVSAVSGRWYFGTDSTSNSTSVGGNVSASFTSARDLVVFTSAGNATLSAGNYWLAHRYYVSDSSTPVFNAASQVCHSAPLPLQPFGDNTTFQAPPQGGGVFFLSTNISNLTATWMPATVAFSDITLSASAAQLSVAVPAVSFMGSTT